MKLCEIILLGALPGLMFCIIPVGGMPFDFSWQLAAIWLGGVAFTAILSSWWMRGFWLLALVRTATILPPDAEAYIQLATIAVFLAAVEGFKRMNRHLRERAMDLICVAAVLLLIWMGWQKAGLMPAHSSAGPFNPDAGGVFLALALPACLRGGERNWRWLWPLILVGIVVTGSTTGMLAAAAAIIIYAVKSGWDWEIVAYIVVVVLLAAACWFIKIDVLDNVAKDNRWVAWKHAAWSMRSEKFGRGLGSWKNTFPLLASGENKLGTVEVAAGKITMTAVFAQAHNEYVQAAYELGLQTLLLIACFITVVAWRIIVGPVSPPAAAGLAALAVACVGWHVFHAAPLALLGCAWLGFWENMEGDAI